MIIISIDIIYVYLQTKMQIEKRKVHVVPPDNVLPDWAWWLSGVAVLQDHHNSAQCNNHEASLSLAFMKSISVIQATNLWE